MRMKITKKQPNSRMCFVCGMDNRFGLKCRFYELEDDQLMALFKPSEEHQGYPGRLHGGIAATVLDETVGRAIMCRHSSNIWGVTVDFSMKLRKPVPLLGEIQVVSRIISETKRAFQGAGEIILANGQVAIEARGKYLKMDIEKIADFDHQGADWQVVSHPADPQYLDLPARL